MQLSKQKYQSIGAALSAAACCLLGADASANSNDSENWRFDTALLYYGEQDRVQAAEALLNARKNFGDDKILNLRLTLDTLTGASANGAVAQPNVQTFTRPSGKGQYQIQAGDVPLDDTFRDTRVQLNAQWTQPWQRDLTLSGGIHVSNEYDYLSLGINGNLAWDFNQKNSTLSLGASYFNDEFSPEGGIPQAFSSMIIAQNDGGDDKPESVYKGLNREESDSKTTLDLLLGFTQVINRNLIMQFNYSHSMVDGYLTDPFKVLSVLDSQGLASDYLFEQRPDKRTKQSVFWKTKYYFDAKIIDLSYRYMWDDWEIKSHTIDSRFRFPLDENSYIEPHLRFYQQSAADFYRPYLQQDAPLPIFASADYRLGEMSAYTFGAKYGRMLSDGHEFSVRLEYYQQQHDNHGVDLPTTLQGLTVFDKVDAVILQFGYSF